jgi:hypothetical protein
VDAFEKLKALAAKADIKHPPKALELPMPKIKVSVVGGWAVVQNSCQSLSEPMVFGDESLPSCLSCGF